MPTKVTTSAAKPERRLAELEQRVQRFESEHAIRACMNRYMVLCDALDARTPLDELVGLFTADAVWEGVGKTYRATFGGIQGHDAIRAMFAGYMREPPHFALNVHFLTSELIELRTQTEGFGRWIMLQSSTFADGRSHLNAARLTVDFARDDGPGECWRMRHFRTENLFSRPVGAWMQAQPVPVPVHMPGQAGD